MADDKTMTPEEKKALEEKREFESNLDTIKGAKNDISNKAASAAETSASVGRLVSDVKGKFSANAGMYGSGSIIGKASKNVFEFPVFVSSNVSVTEATAINSLLEQIYASYLQMAISMDPVVTASDVRRGVVFQNLKTNTTKYLEYATQFYAQEACHNVIEMDDVICEFDMVTLSDDDYDLIRESLEYAPLAEFAHYFQEASDPDDDDEEEADDWVDSDDEDAGIDYGNPRDYTLGKRKEQRAAAKEEREQRKDEREAAREERSKRESAQKLAHNTARNKREEEEHEARMKQMEEREKRERLQAQRDKKRLDLAKAKDKRDADRDKRDAQSQALHDMIATKNAARAKEKHAVDMKVKASQLVDETKIQKMNTMKPLMMTVGVKVMSEKGGTVSDMLDYMVGVKTHCRIIKADILPEVAEYPIKEMNRLARKAKWRAGEIKFLDYLFNRPEKKQAAIDSKDPNKRWYHRLYTLAHSKGSSAVAKKVSGSYSKAGLIPNVSMIITKSDVDAIKEEKDIDLLKGSTAVRFCKELFLMALIVVDSDTQSVKILLPDVHNDYEIHSMASINKQIETLDTANVVSREVKRLMNGR